jgi:formylglycine-generating enzyme required for sulfatase activity
MSEQISQSRWQWTAIIVLAAGLLYVGWQSQGGAARIRDAAEHLVQMQNQLRTSVAEQQEVTQRLAQVVQQVDTAVQAVEEAQSALETLQQGVDERLTGLQNQLEPAIAGQQADARRLGQIEDQVFTAITRQQAATQRLSELAGQVESVTQELREAHVELDAVWEKIEALTATPPPAAALDTEPSNIWANSLDMAFVLVPADTFDMGSDRGEDDERPARSVTIGNPFYIGQFEVTQAQWFAVMESDPSQFSDDPSRPVENVSWNDAREFIAKLNAMEPEATYRLPTEAEWEYAARAGSTAAYAFGDDAAQLQAYAWYADNAENTTHPVGQKQPNAWGVHAMHGGVWEWTQDRYRPYRSEAAPESPTPPPGTRRVLRGGSWLSPAEDCRAASRSHAHPAFRGAHVGFRLVRTLP